MIRLKDWMTYGWEEAIRGMRNPLNSWDKSDSQICDSGADCEGCIHEKDSCDCFVERRGTYTLGVRDYSLMKKLRKAGPDHRKFMRMITVYVDITAPLYWWKEFDTYKVGTVANSCSTMHTIHKKEFTFDDFSHEHLISTMGESYEAMDCLADIIFCLNKYRDLYLEADVDKQKIYWYQMIQLLPSSYNQKRTVMLNYEVLANMYKSRKNHKLDEWHVFCDWIKKTLPYSELITGEESE